MPPRPGVPGDGRSGSPGMRRVGSVPAALPAGSDSPRAHRSGRRSQHVHRLPQMHRSLPRRRAHHGPRVTYDTDVLVIGAGPAGAVAAWEAKRAAPELDVVLLERDARVGTPVRCAEGVGDAGVANVGLGLVALKADARNAREYLDAWIARRYPRGAKTACTVGGVIAHTTIRQTYTDGVLVAGDAAHMINPLSGGGIVNAMKAGRLAGSVAAAAIRAGDTSASRLSAYHAERMELLGGDHLKYYRLKRALEDLDDQFFNSLARIANTIPPEKRTLGRIFAHALVRHPQLIPVAARIFIYCGMRNGSPSVIRYSTFPFNSAF